MCVINVYCVLRSHELICFFPLPRFCYLVCLIVVVMRLISFPNRVFVSMLFLRAGEAEEEGGLCVFGGGEWRAACV